MGSGADEGDRHILIPALLALLSSLWAFASTQAPFLWAGLSLGLLALVAFRRSRVARRRIWWFNIGVILVILALAEGLSVALETRGLRGEDAPGDSQGTQSEGLYPVVASEILGYRPPSLHTGRAWKSVDGETIFDVTYRTDAHGLRVEPPHRPDPGEAVLLFGGSYTFGEGVEDQETLPYQLGVQTEGAHRIYNFGACGYGPHQMLAALEQGWVDQIVTEKIIHVIYQGLYPEHLFRASGLRTWGKHGPCYSLGNGDEAVYRGHFDDHDLVPDSPFRVGLYLARRQLRRSSIIRRGLDRKRPLRPEDHALFRAILLQSRELVRRRNPEATFHLLWWDEAGEGKGLAGGLEKEGVRVHDIVEILRRHQPEGPRRIPGDTHPTPEVHGILAAYFSRLILGEEA